MSLTLKDVEHIADLARLELSEEEKVKYSQQLSAILDYVERLQELDTHSIPPTSSVLPDRGVLREDIPGETLPISTMQSNAPDMIKDQFRVPPVRE